MGNKQQEKGAATEELLRSYFIHAGYYVVRGVPFVYEGFDVTDIDIWLYGRASSLSREISIVDCKNRKTPQAIERIFWVRGLQLATDATNAIVATTEKRPAVKDFGRRLGVAVLDGAFLARLKSFEASTKSRLSEEGFQKEIAGYSLAKLDGDWAGRIALSKSLLASGLTFDACNEWLEQARFFAEQVVTKPSQRSLGLRCMYLICSFFCIAIDYLLRELAFVEQAERERLVSEGIRYGSRGSAGMDGALNVAMSLVEEHAAEGHAISSQIRQRVYEALSSLRTDGLGEYLSRADVARSLFPVAKELESLAMSSQPLALRDASVEVRALVGVLVDYWGIDRVMFAGASS